MSERTTIDARGAFCPGPLMELIAALKLVNIGDEIEILSTDKGTANDVPEWVAKVGHEMVGVTQRDDDAWSVVVRKAK
ncbi:sulfurtransferase TusA family protein [Varunaivibrio sulfuroxidans]|uniref:TusA-related sulfurtransferase n=1 Tax=Varunaivibrio sulfuroxidans TaxID=1773489 RepID=A0A4R3J6X3_9PROT|nr:sulfurtransferase TusA family protein [Varunaivibrio sulfuroxidans]TCS60623.1 TusA-related sulfurtransferase [Varunaivibrio sulfuroxidans]WES30112.1 sulfurtransferase TusA family protein [Varunaivibrio sulfuroxidans]